jgi:hypothetical protein
MKTLSTFVFIFFMALLLPACFTVHQPSLASNSLAYLPPANLPRVEAAASRHYFLAFGGANKEGMMDEALKEISANYAGYLPYTLENISIDQKKTTVFFLYNRHKLQLAANMKFAYNGYLNESFKAIKEKKHYGFNTGDLVTLIEYGIQPLSVCIITDIISKDAIKLRRIAYIGDTEKKVNAEREIICHANDIKLLEKHKSPAKEGNNIVFYPVGYAGEPMTGILKEHINNKTAHIILDKQSKSAWQALGGELTAEGGIYAPVHRILPSEKAALLETNDATD